MTADSNVTNSEYMRHINYVEKWFVGCFFRPEDYIVVEAPVADETMSTVSVNTPWIKFNKWHFIFETR
jgi:hypothetical protein